MMKKPVLLTTLSLVLTLGIAGVVNAAINPTNQQAVNSMLNNPAPSIVSTGAAQAPASQTAKQTAGQPTHQQAGMQQFSGEQPAVTPASPAQNYMYGQMNSSNMPIYQMQGANMPMNEEMQNTPSNMPAMSQNHMQNYGYEQNAQQSANQANPNTASSGRAMNSYANHTGLNSMGHMGR